MFRDRLNRGEREGLGGGDAEGRPSVEESGPFYGQRMRSTGNMD